MKTLSRSVKTLLARRSQLGKGKVNPKFVHGTSFHTASADWSHAFASCETDEIVERAKSTLCWSTYEIQQDITVPGAESVAA